MDFNALEDFQLVAAHGGFGKASRASGRSKATLSRRISDLEESLGVRLIERGRQRLALTDAGQQLLSRTESPMRDVAEALTAAKDGRATPRGVLRIAAPLLFSQLALGRICARFLAAYPEVQLEVTSEDRIVDLVEEHYDVTIRINPREDATLVGRRFAKDRLFVTAAPSVPMPASRGKKPCPVPAVVMPSYRDGELWSLQKSPTKIEPRPVLRLSSLLTVRDAVLAGAGVALLPQSIIGDLLESGKLVAWATAGHDVELWVLHTSRRLASPKVRAFVDFLCTQYPTGWFTPL